MSTYLAKLLILLRRALHRMGALVPWLAFGGFLVSAWVQTASLAVNDLRMSTNGTELVRAAATARRFLDAHFAKETAAYLASFPFSLSMQLIWFLSLAPLAMVPFAVRLAAQNPGFPSLVRRLWFLQILLGWTTVGLGAYTTWAVGGAPASVAGRFAMDGAWLVPAISICSAISVATLAHVLRRRSVWLRAAVLTALCILWRPSRLFGPSAMDGWYRWMFPDTYAELMMSRDAHRFAGVGFALAWGVACLLLFHFISRNASAPRAFSARQPGLVGREA
jgi:hypothetical protein